VDREALLIDDSRVSRALVGGLAHDFNSALQSLIDALFAVRDDARILLDKVGARPEQSADLASSLDLVGDAERRLMQIAEILPNVVADHAPKAGPIDLAAELRTLIELPWHGWRRRVQIVAEIDRGVAPFTCEWWIARLGIHQQLMLATSVCGALALDDAPYQIRLQINAIEDRLVVQTRIGSSAGEAIRLPLPGDASLAEACSRLEACAALLAGTVTISPDESAESVFCFPIREVTQ
jgi:hypothetical protein